MSPKVVLVTGGTGLVGRAVEKEIAAQAPPQEQWVFVGSKDADLRDAKSTEAMFERVRPTHVLHLAAKVGGLFLNMRCPVEMWKENIEMNTNVMEACRKFKVEKLITALSMCIFPNEVTYPIDETMLHKGPAHEGLIGYAMAKRMVDIMNRCYHKEYGCKFTSVIPTNIFGPHDNYNLEDAHVIPALIHKCYIAKQDGTPLTIMGSGKPLRQFIYSADIAKLLIWAVHKYDDLDPLILSVGEEDEVTIKEAAEAVVRHMKFEGEVIFDTTKADGQLKKTANIAKLRKYLPDFKFTKFDDAMREAVQWFVDNFETARK